jgi:hypothetical protein
MADVEALDIRDGLHERFRTVRGLNKLLTYEPRTIQNPPLLYTIYRDYEKLTERQQILVEVHSFIHRVCFSWADPEKAEDQLLRMVTDIPASVESDPLLGGRIAAYVAGTQVGGGGAIVSEGKAGFTIIDGSTYRIVDWTSRVVAKRTIVRNRIGS